MPGRMTLRGDGANRAFRRRNEQVVDLECPVLSESLLRSILRMWTTQPLAYFLTRPTEMGPAVRAESVCRAKRRTTPRCVRGRGGDADGGVEGSIVHRKDGIRAGSVYERYNKHLTKSVLKNFVSHPRLMVKPSVANAHFRP